MAGYLNSEVCMRRNEEAFAEMEKLSKDIAKHAELYFKKNKSVISDFAYDELVKRFKHLCKRNPKLAELFTIHKKPVPIAEPGGQGLDVVRFTEPMQSLDKSYVWEDVERFFARLPADTAYYYELKLDGLALEFTYENHALVRITTRGDGEVGEDVTHALPLFGYIPMEIPKEWPSEFRVRGEAIIPYELFHLYNETAVKQAASPRNAVSGWVRATKKNQNQAIHGLLNFYVYWASDKLDCAKYSQLVSKLGLHGFYTPPKASLEAIKENLEQDDWPCDGIVIKVDDFELREKQGGNNQYPFWATAWKYPNEEKHTTMEDVEWNTTKTGRVVPVAIYFPVKFGGIECARASIDNYYQFVRLGLRADSVINVTRNGDVIPRVDSVAYQGEGEKFEAPTECPSCGSVLEVRKGRSSAELVCNNTVECEAQLLMRCVDLVGKKCLDIKGLGPVGISQLIDLDLVKMPADLLKSTRASSQYSSVYTKEIAEQIETALHQPMYKIIKALGLPNIDLTRAKKLANAWANADQSEGLLEWLKTPANLMSIDGISAGIALPIAKILKSDVFFHNADTIIHLLKEQGAGADVEYWIKGCITGTLGQTREELMEVFGDKGIELVENLTKDCQFLIVGEAPSKSKVLKATELGIVIVDGTKATSIEKLIEGIKGIPL